MATWEPCHASEFEDVEPKVAYRDFAELVLSAEEDGHYLGNHTPVLVSKEMSAITAKWDESFIETPLVEGEAPFPTGCIIMYPFGVPTFILWGVSGNGLFEHGSRWDIHLTLVSFPEGEVTGAGFFFKFHKGQYFTLHTEGNQPSQEDDIAAMVNLGTLRATWALMNSKIFIGKTTPKPRRHAGGSLVNVPDLLVYRLRKREYGKSGNPVDVQWSHRWVVNGHWANIACGPGRKQRRPVYIAPYVKGPEDKPLVIKNRIHWLKD